MLLILHLTNLYSQTSCDYSIVGLSLYTIKVIKPFYLGLSLHKVKNLFNK